MQFKAIHLLLRLQKIERDLAELSELQNAVQSDRVYARAVRSSLEEEARHLQRLKKDILAQVVKNPPEFLRQTLVGKKKPELLLPTSKQKKSKEPPYRFHFK